MNIKEVVTAYRSPWQNGYVERLIGSVRRECLDHVISINEKHLRRLLREYFAYYNKDRTHCGIAKDAPIQREVQARPVDGGKVIALPRVGGLHHRYEWRKAA
jgi:hypothetical protein